MVPGVVEIGRSEDECRPGRAEVGQVNARDATEGGGDKMPKEDEVRYDVEGNGGKFT